MKIKTRLYLSTCVSIAGIIGIAVFSLMTILMVKDKITVLTSQSTPLQVKTVQFQQAVEKLSADLLQLGLANDPQEVKQISGSISRSREHLEKLNAEIKSLNKNSMETGVFTELHDQVLKATDEKFKSMAVYKEEASKVNGAMVRIDKSLIGLKDIISGLVISASRRAATATKTLNETLSDKNTVPDLLTNVQNFRNEVDHDIELNKKINAINDIVYMIGVDAKLLDAKARMIMLSDTPTDLDRATSEVQVIQARIARNVSQAGKGVKEIKSSGFVDDAVASINAAVGSAGTSLRTISTSQRKVLDNMNLVAASVAKIKSVALEQGQKSEANVQTTAQEQQKFVSVVSQRVDLFKRLLIGIALSVVAIALLINITTTVCINRSLKRMTDTFTVIAETGDFTKTAIIKNDDEFGVTVRAFNKMKESFAEILSAVSASTQSLTDSSHGLNSTAQEIHKSIGNQSASIQQVAAASMEVSQTISMISGNTERIRVAVEDARSSALSGANIVSQAGGEVGEIARAVEESTGIMQALYERTQQVGEIVDVIVEITDQTNLLALNAAIEAARAGDHGRGFAVVADEVRKLANSTASATVDITERIKSIQNDTELAVKAMQSSMKKVHLGVEYSEQAGESLKKIVDSVSELHEMAGEIASATVDLAKASDEISSDFMKVEQSAAETVQSAADIARESDNLSRLSINLKDEISRYTYAEQHKSEPLAVTKVKHTDTGSLRLLRPKTSYAT
jgi:methyl-accepting chemotaxis protein